MASWFSERGFMRSRKLARRFGHRKLTNAQVKKILQLAKDGDSEGKLLVAALNTWRAKR
jgi:hypothetical protein